MYAEDNQVNCFSGCSHAGVCKSGWCHCEPGRWGIDCSRTKASAQWLLELHIEAWLQNGERATMHLAIAFSLPD